MDKDTRNAIERATQRARKLLEEDFSAQLEGDLDVHRTGAVAAKAGSHLSARQAFQRERIVAAIEHKRAAGMSAPDAVADYLRDAAFTTLNRFVALKMLEARALVQECITKGEQSSGYREFCGLAPGLPLLPGSAGYRLYIESLFDELSTEVKVLFDRRDPSSVLWPKRATFEQLLEILNDGDLAGVWGVDETIGWVYQFFNASDERRKMREESQAPRNSRELAIRNQFFTPRYVVQFLTDNTLGRIWYEMRGTKTSLAERCEYMVRRPGEEFAPRPKKDPRDLRVLDPACGSAHFLLYAFDLLLAIYDEAYADPESPKSDASGRTLAEDYPNLDAIRKAAPGLILAHNLHGVDIDARCAQIAQLALWMRAQRAYRDLSVGRAERPQIRRSNIVLAEPLVADDRLAAEFVATLGDAELGHVFTDLVDALKLAGDLGLLLRIETLLAHQPTRGESGDLFAPPGARIRAALARFISEKGERASTRRRLFAEDSAQGVGLLATAETRFDVVLMNPPFGAGSTRAKKDFDKAYPRTKNDLYAAFVERGVELLNTRGRLGAITSRTGFFLSSFQRWREELLVREAPPAIFADLGYGVLDSALVEVAAYCLEKNGGVHASFLRTLDAAEKGTALLQLIRGRDSALKNGLWYDVSVESFRAVPGSPFAYWVSDHLRSLFATLPSYEADDRTARVGLQTNDDFRWLRTWWEPSMSREDEAFLVPLAKGGANSPYFADLAVGIRWGNDGRWIKAWKSDQLAKGLITANNSKCWNESYYLRPGLTWPHRSATFAAAALPSGCVFGQSGKTAFAPAEQLYPLLALFNSRLVTLLLRVQSDAVRIKFEVGLIQKLPLCRDVLNDVRLGELARRAWGLRRLLDGCNETSHAFLLPAGLIEKAANVDHDAIVSELSKVQREIDDRVFAFYGISAAHRVQIDDSVSLGTEGDDTEDDEDGAAEEVALATSPTHRFLSWLVGVAFGRFDYRLATSERPIPGQPEPFDPLPSRSPGMWPEGERPADLPDILSDDEGHADDLVARVIGVAEEVGWETPRELRGWLAREFFPLHIRMYSKSRRKAPIYWQLATPSASYSVWLHIHAFTKDTLFRVQNDYVVPKLAHEERRLEAMAREQRDKATAAERKALAAQEAFVEELRALLDEVKRVAPLWKPNLDDGVIINFAPLWRLVPHHKPWQKELKAVWDALCEGKYDWAHLAMHLWPERVVPKCATDRSLAIAHGLEDVFWVEGTDGKWTARKIPTRPTEDLVRERVSPAVKAALKSLLDAPLAAGNGIRGRGSRRRTAASAN